MGGHALALALVGFNAWWYVRDTRPVPDLKSIGRLIALGRHDESDRALREHLRRSPRDGGARMMLARSLAARGELLGCAEQLHLVPYWWPSKREALYFEGESYLSVDRARDAETAWRACAQDDPLHPTLPEHRRAAVEGLIKLYAAQERWEEANEIAWGLYGTVGPSDRPGVLVLRLRTEVQRISAETRARRLRRYVGADPGDRQSRRGLALAEQAMGREAEATRQMRACLAARPDDLRAWCDWLGILMGRGDMSGLASALERLPEAADGDGRVWSYRGSVRQAEGDFAGAVKAHRRAAGLRPHDELVLYRLALAEQRAGSRDRAEALLARYRAVRDSREALPDALQAYHQALTTGRPDELSRLASLCETLGLAREAEALRSSMPD